MNSSKENVNSNKKYILFLIFLGWLMNATSYLGKVNYSANITQIIDFYGITKAQAGTVPTFFFFSYGIGQVLNGIFCKKYNLKVVIFSSMLCASIINLVIATTSDFSIIKWLWLANGFVLSVLWPGLIRMLSESLPKKSLGTSSVIMGTSTAAGTLIIYGLSSIFARFNNFKLAFYTAGIAIIVAAFVWFFSYDKLVSRSKAEKALDKTNAETKTADRPVLLAKEKKQLFATIYVLCICAIGVNLIRDGLTTWVPSILKEEFAMTDSLSILLTLFLPALSAFGNATSLKIHKMIPDYVNQCMTTFALIAALICIIIGSLAFEIVAVMLIGLVLANFFASTLNSLITSIFPMFMREKVNSGMFAGVLNGFCYVGSALSTYGLGTIADNFGWTAVFCTLIGFCILTFLVWIGYTSFKTFLNKKQSV